MTGNVTTPRGGVGGAGVIGETNAMYNLYCGGEEADAAADHAKATTKNLNLKQQRAGEVPKIQKTPTSGQPIKKKKKGGHSKEPKQDVHMTMPEGSF